MAEFLQRTSGMMEFRAMDEMPTSGQTEVHMSFKLAPQNKHTIITKRSLEKIRDHGSMVLEESLLEARHTVSVNGKDKEVRSYVVVFPHINGIQTEMLMICIDSEDRELECIRLGYDNLRRREVVLDLRSNKFWMTLPEPSIGVVETLQYFYREGKAMESIHLPEPKEVGLA